MFRQQQLGKQAEQLQEQQRVISIHQDQQQQLFPPVRLH